MIFCDIPIYYYLCIFIKVLKTNEFIKHNILLKIWKICKCNSKRELKTVMLIYYSKQVKLVYEKITSANSFKLPPLFLNLCDEQIEQWYVMQCNSIISSRLIGSFISSLTSFFHCQLFVWNLEGENYSVYKMFFFFKFMV